MNIVSTFKNFRERETNNGSYIFIFCFHFRNCGIPKKILKGKIKQDKKVPQVTSYRELHLQVFSILRYLGPYTAYDPVLISKIIRLGKTFMSKVRCYVLNITGR